MIKIAFLTALHLEDTLCERPAVRTLKQDFPYRDSIIIGLPSTQSSLSRYNYIDPDQSSAL